MGDGEAMTPGARLDAVARRHFRWGWTLLLIFLAIGLALESLHGFKAGFYLDAGNETRRLLWTLGHAHGALLALVNVVFGLYLGAARFTTDPPQLALASACLLSGTLLLPFSFLLSGTIIYGGDPGVLIYLAPIGAVLLIVAVGLVARMTFSRR